MRFSTGLSCVIVLLLTFSTASALFTEDNNDISAQDYRSLQMQGYNQAIRPNSHRRKKSSRRKRLPSYGNGPGATKSIRRVPQLQRAPKSQQVASPLAVPQRQPRLPPPPQTRPLQTGYTDGLAQKLADARTRVATAAVQGVHGTLDAATAHAERVLSQPWIKHPAADSNTPKGDVANPDIESTESDAGPMEYGDSQIADYDPTTLRRRETPGKWRLSRRALDDQPKSESTRGSRNLNELD